VRRLTARANRLVTSITSNEPIMPIPLRVSNDSCFAAQSSADFICVCRRVINWIMVSDSTWLPVLYTQCRFTKPNPERVIFLPVELDARAEYILCASPPSAQVVVPSHHYQATPMFATGRHPLRFLRRELHLQTSRIDQYFLCSLRHPCNYRPDNLSARSFRDIRTPVSGEVGDE
jgi:hypothetical protein